MLDYPKTADGSYFELPDKKENAILTIGRAATSFRVFLESMGRKNEGHFKNLMKGGSETFEGIGKKLLQALSDCESFAKNEPEGGGREKFEFYQLLGKLYYEELKFIFKQSAEGETPASIQKTAALFRGAINKKALTDCKVCFDLLMAGKFYM